MKRSDTGHVGGLRGGASVVGKGLWQKGLCATGLMMACAATAMGVPGSNTCATATAFSGSATLEFDSTGATQDGPNASCTYLSTSQPDLWYEYTATVTGQVQINAPVCGYDSLGNAVLVQLTVFNSCSGAQVAGLCSPDICYDTPVSFQVTNGTKYLIRAATYDSPLDGLGNGEATINVQQITSPSNDLCANAATLTAGPGLPVVFTGAGNEGSALVCSEAQFQPGNRDVWYTYQATQTGTAVFDISGPSDVVMSVLSGCGGPVIDCDGSLGASRLFLSTQQGAIYTIRVASTSSSNPARTISVQTFAAPGNDNCSTATPIGAGVVLNGAPVNVAWNNSGAAEGPNEPAPKCVPTEEATASIWYVYTPNASGVAVFNTDGSEVDTFLSAYNTCGGDEIASHNNVGPQYEARDSAIAVPVTAGVPVYVRLGQVITGANTDYYRSGTMSVSLVSPIAGDDCSTAASITLPTTYFSNYAATGFETEPLPFVKDVWFTWTPDADGSAIVTTCGSVTGTYINSNTILSAYRGSCTGELIATNDNDEERHDPPCGAADHSNSYLTMNVVAGTQYLFRVGSGNYNNLGSRLLTVTFTAFESAVNEYTLPGHDAGDSIATAMPAAGDGGSLGAILGTFSTGTFADVYKIEICNPDVFYAKTENTITEYDTLLALFDSDGNPVVMNDNTFTSFRASLTNEFVFDAGTYYLAVTGASVHPLSAGGQIWETEPRSVERNPDGPGADGVLTGWSSEGVLTPASNYRVDLQGVCTVMGSPVCPGDFNNSGSVTADDIFAFLDAWFAQNGQSGTGLSADVNASGSVTADDIFAYLDLWFANNGNTCP